MERDEELYARLKSGDLTAFDVLYERHQTGLFSFLVGYLKSKEEAEEVFHETFISILRQTNAKFEEGGFRGWLYLIARNGALNRLRSRKRQLKAQDELGAAPSSTEIESEILNRDFAERLKLKIAELPHELSETLKMRLSGLSYQDIAQALEVPVGTVKSRLHSLVERLRTELTS